MEGWYELSKSIDGQFCFSLKAANGEVILISELYRSRRGAEEGIASVRVSSQHDERYARRTGSNGQFFFNLKGSNHRVIATSQIYNSATACEAGLLSVRRNGAIAAVREKF